MWPLIFKDLTSCLADEYESDELYGVERFKFIPNKYLLTECEGVDAEIFRLAGMSWMGNFHAMWPCLGAQAHRLGKLYGFYSI